MDELRLVEPTVTLQNSYIEMLAEWDGHEKVPYVLNWDCSDFEAFVQRHHNMRDGIELSKNFVSCSTFWLVNPSDEILGVSNLRHTLNDILLIRGGHIGYGIKPSARRKGLATAILRMTLERARAMGITRALVTCHDDNMGSQKTILNNGGVFWRTTEWKGKVVLGYWIQVS